MSGLNLWDSVHINEIYPSHLLNTVLRKNGLTTHLVFTAF